MSTQSFVLPSRSKVGYLDPSIAGEGQHVFGEDGETFNFTPPPEKLVMPDMSNVKSLRKYFGRVNLPAFPAWVYHSSEPPRKVMAVEAGELGVCYRETTPDEQIKFGKTHVWDWTDETLWRPTPYAANSKRDPYREAGKERPANVSPRESQNELVKALIPEVAGAIAREMRGASAPSNVSADDWQAFQQFLTWKRANEAVSASSPPIATMDSDPLGPATTANALGQTGTTEAEERSLWIEEATERGITIDRRWSLARIKEAVEKGA